MVQWWVKDLVLLQLWCRLQLPLRFNPWPRNFHVLWVWLKKKKKKKKRNINLMKTIKDLGNEKRHKGSIQDVCIQLTEFPEREAREKEFILKIYAALKSDSLD